MKTTLLSILVLVSACGRDARYTGFETQVHAFEARLGHPVTNVIVEFGEVEHAARCDTKLFGTPRVTIRKDLWQYASPTSRELVVFHELGHCVLGKGHEEEKVSVMNPVQPPDTIYEHHKEEMLAELFD